MEQAVVVALLAGLVLGWLLRGRRARREQIPPLPPPAPRLSDPGLADEIERLIINEGKIQAIKRYREMHHASLKEAKEAVEAIERRLRSSG